MTQKLENQMLLTVKQLAKILNISAPTTYRLLKTLKIATKTLKNGTTAVDTSSIATFTLSLRLQNQEPEYQVVYSIQDLANIGSRDKKTILSLLHKLNVPLYGNKKKYVLLWDLKQTNILKRTNE